MNPLALVAAAALIPPAITTTADHRWGPPPCGPVTVAISRTLDVAGADPDACLIVLNPRTLRLPRPLLCTVWLHERGHLAGYYNPVGALDADGTRDHAHSPNPRSIMYPEVDLDVARVQTRHGWRTVYPGAARACTTRAQRLQPDPAP